MESIIRNSRGACTGSSFSPPHCSRSAVQWKVRPRDQWPTGAIGEILQPPLKEQGRVIWGEFEMEIPKTPWTPVRSITGRSMGSMTVNSLRFFA